MPLISQVIIFCWVIFWIYWFIKAFGAKKGTSYKLRQFAGVRISIFIIAIIVIRSFNLHSQNIKNGSLLTTNKTVLIIGLIIFLIGIGLAIWARVYLGRNWGMPMTQKKDPELVTSGPYRYVRHPIYSGILLAFIGSTLAVSIYWLAIFIIAGAYFLYSAVQEEKLMGEQFPKDYPNYKAKTKMLVPFIL